MMIIKKTVQEIGCGTASLRNTLPSPFEFNDVASFPVHSKMRGTLRCRTWGPKLLCAPRAARWLTPLSARNSATGRGAQPRPGHVRFARSRR